MSESNDELTYMRESPRHIDPVPAAGEDEDNAAVAEQSKKENYPDSASEGPPDRGWGEEREIEEEEVDEKDEEEG